MSPFLGPLITLFWPSGDFCPRFQSRLLALSPACNRILRFTSGATPADLLGASMAAESFSSTYLQTSKDWDLSCRRYLTVWDQAGALPTDLCRIQVFKSSMFVIFSSEFCQISTLLFLKFNTCGVDLMDFWQIQFIVHYLLRFTLFLAL